MSMPGSSSASPSGPPAPASLVRRDACPPLKRRWKKTPNSRSTACSIALNSSAIVVARSFASELRGTCCFPRVGRGAPQILLRRLEPRTRVALLRHERAQTLLFICDTPLRRADLLAERVAHADRRAPALLHR